MGAVYQYRFVRTRPDIPLAKDSRSLDGRAHRAVLHAGARRARVLPLSRQPESLTAGSADSRVSHAGGGTGRPILATSRSPTILDRNCRRLPPGLSVRRTRNPRGARPDHGRTEAKDVAREFPKPPRAVEGDQDRAGRCHGGRPQAQSSPQATQGGPPWSDRSGPALISANARRASQAALRR
jgi:hypothetical protein